MNQLENREEFLKGPNVAVLATVTPKGNPHAVAIWYLYEDEVFVMNADPSSQKLRNIQANPNVTLVIDRRSLPYYSVMAQGVAEGGPALSEETRLKLAVRYLGEELAQGYMARMRGAGNMDGSASIRLRPTKVMEFLGTSGRAGSS